MKIVAAIVFGICASTFVVAQKKPATIFLACDSTMAAN